MDNVVLKADSKSFTVYPQRWYVLTVVCFLAFSNNTLWLSYVTLTSATSAFYCGQIIEADEDRCGVTYWTSQIFQIVGVLSGIFGMYITDKYGIRVSCYLGSLMNLIGAIIRLISSLPNIQIQSRLPLLYFGQTIAALAQPFFLCLSPKVAEFWFAENQRGLANALTFIANPLGVGIGCLIPSWIVSNSIKVTTNSMEIFYLNALTLTLALIVMVMSFGVSSGKPPTPPSASSENDNTPNFIQGLKQLCRNRQFYIQMLTFGLAFAIEWSLFVTIDPMLVEIGYNSINGYLISMTAISGVFGSILAGFIVDKNKRFNEVIKSCYIGIAICASAICLFVRHKNTDGSFYLSAILVILIILLGFFAIPVFPVGKRRIIIDQFNIS
uniref:MFS domain-containing protein n=1 Tax=Ascaris lumbricoides TaxID=6252 RepID=A0A0M3IN46_ASCLU